MKNNVRKLLIKIVCFPSIKTIKDCKIYYNHLRALSDLYCDYIVLQAKNEECKNKENLLAFSNGIFFHNFNREINNVQYYHMLFLDTGNINVWKQYCILNKRLNEYIDVILKLFNKNYIDQYPFYKSLGTIKPDVYIWNKIKFVKDEN